MSTTENKLYLIVSEEWWGGLSQDRCRLYTSLKEAEKQADEMSKKYDMSYSVAEIVPDGSPPKVIKNY